MKSNKKNSQLRELKKAARFLDTEKLCREVGELRTFPHEGYVTVSFERLSSVHVDCFSSSEMQSRIEQNKLGLVAAVMLGCDVEASFSIAEELQKHVEKKLEKELLLNKASISANEERKALEAELALEGQLPEILSKEGWCPGRDGGDFRPYQVWDYAWTIEGVRFETNSFNRSFIEAELGEGEEKTPLYFAKKMSHEEKAKALAAWFKRKGSLEECPMLEEPTYEILLEKNQKRIDLISSIL